MIDFGKIFITFCFVGLVIFGLISFGSQMQSDNNAEQNVQNYPFIGGAYSNLESNLSVMSTQSESQKTLFESENPTSGVGSILLFSILSAGKVFNGMILSIYNVFIILPANILNISPVVMSVINAILLISLIIGLWTLYRIGS